MFFFLKCKTHLQVLVITVLGVLGALDFLPRFSPPKHPLRAEQNKNQARCLPDVPYFLQMNPSVFQESESWTCRADPVPAKLTALQGARFLLRHDPGPWVTR